MNTDDLPLATCSEYLPDDALVYTVERALQITAAAVHPKTRRRGEARMLSDLSDLAYFATYDAHQNLIGEAALAGNVVVLNPLTNTPHTLPMGAALLQALIPRDELKRFAAQKLRIQLMEPEVPRSDTGAGSAQQGAIDDANLERSQQGGDQVVGNAALPLDRMERRAELLKRFRALGGKRLKKEGKKGRRGALAALERETGINDKNLGLMLDAALDDERRGAVFSALQQK